MTTQPLGARRTGELLARHGIRPKRSLGQNFVIDPNTIRKVVSVASLAPGDRVLEIGPGIGTLTLGLAEAAAHVVALEVDDRLLPALAEAIAGVANVEVVHGDALALDLSVWDATHLVANLPYNIAVPIVMRVLEHVPGIAELTVMTQAEVGERLAAAPGSKSYGQVSVMVGYHAHASVAARVSRRAFFPVPNVDSVLVRIVRDDPPDVARPAMAAVVRAAFGHRRKTLRNNLAGVFGSTEAAAAALATAGLDPRARAEQVPLEGFVRLARAVREPGPARP
ncbi:MAG: 16S rRNA (adenine(1518)-N(6)/adenine(1519)-N(6))-dimethyltransferase RsmA [Actinomycetota bacterium]